MGRPTGSRDAKDLGFSHVLGAFHSPSRCPHLARRSPDRQTSSCSHTCGVLPALHPESELLPARRRRTSGAEQRPQHLVKLRPLRAATPQYAGASRLWTRSRRTAGQWKAEVSSVSCCAAAAGSRAGAVKASKHRTLDCNRAIPKEPRSNGVSS